VSQPAPPMSFPKPGPEHEVFQKDVGTWDATIETRMAPGAPPSVSHGVMTSQLACNGRWLIAQFRNETSGFEGHGIYGFDASKGTYTAVWVDPLRTFLAPMEGTYDPAKKTMTFVGEARKPDGSALRWREVTETVDPDTQIFRSFMPLPSGGEFEMMTVTYKRRK
jgi:hypothetical protein